MDKSTLSLNKTSYVIIPRKTNVFPVACWNPPVCPSVSASVPVSVCVQNTSNIVSGTPPTILLQYFAHVH